MNAEILHYVSKYSQTYSLNLPIWKQLFNKMWATTKIHLLEVPVERLKL